MQNIQDFSPVLRIIEDIIFAPMFGGVICLLIPFGFMYRIIKWR